MRGINSGVSRTVSTTDFRDKEIHEIRAGPASTEAVTPIVGRQNDERK